MVRVAVLVLQAVWRRRLRNVKEGPYLGNRRSNGRVCTLV